MAHEKNPEDSGSEGVVSGLIRSVCRRNFGVLEDHFLCQSVGILNPTRPVCFAPDTPVRDAVAALTQHNIGCVLVVDKVEKVIGILTERDCVKLLNQGGADLNRPISDFMTHDPVCASPDATIAYVLNLMSHGDFRNLPLIDAKGAPIGFVSARNVIDYMAKSFMDALQELALEPIPGQESATEDRR